MALRYAVNSLDEVAEAHRSLYRADEAGGFKLDLEGYESASTLLEAKRREKDLRVEAETKLRELLAAQSVSKGTTDSDYQFAQEQAALAKKIPESLRAHAYGSPEYLAALAAYDAEHGPAYIEKLTEAATASRQAEIASLRADLERVTEDNAALDIAVELARAPEYHEVLLPHIRERLQGRRDENGKFSDATRAEVAAQLRGTPSFWPIIRGASPAEKAAHMRKVAETLGVPPARQPLTRAKFEALSPERRAESVRAGTTILDG
jgi:hypothetical protein